MAREQRKDVDYFPHECTHGRKMHIIETKYGNDGYATWFKLLEQLGKANNHYIDISDDMTLMFLTSTFKIDEEKTLAILNDLAKLGSIDKFLFDEYKIIWSEKFCNSIEDAYRKRKQKLFLKEDILALKNSISRGNHPIPRGLNEETPKNTPIRGNTAESIPKEKNSIVKKSKEEFADKSADNFFKENEDINSSEKKRKKVAPKKEKEIMHWKALVDTWFKYYKSKFIIEPSFNATQGKFLKQIIERFEILAQKNDAEKNIAFEWSEDRAVRTFLKFLDNAWNDNWLQNHFLLKNLQSSFDAIISKKNTEYGTQQQSQSSGTKKQFRFNTSQAIKTITGTDTGGLS